MPIQLVEDRHEETRDEQAARLALFDESGELTLAGSVVLEFLEHADFDAVFEHPEAKSYIVARTDEQMEEEGAGGDYLPGDVVVQLVDEDDLASMFGHYLSILHERATAEDAPLDEKARWAVFAPLFPDIDGLDEKFKRGAFRKLRKTKGGEDLVNDMLGAMQAKGVVKRSKKSGGGYKGGDWEKGPKYKTGGTAQSKRKAKAIARKKKAKRKQRVMKGKAARRKAAALAASVGMEEAADFVFGEGIPFEGCLFQVGTKDDAKVVFEGEADEDTGAEETTPTALQTALAGIEDMGDRVTMMALAEKYAVSEEGGDEEGGEGGDGDAEPAGDGDGDAASDDASEPEGDEQEPDGDGGEGDEEAAADTDAGEDGGETNEMKGGKHGKKKGKMDYPESVEALIASITDEDEKKAAIAIAEKYGMDYGNGKGKDAKSMKKHKGMKKDEGKGDEEVDEAVTATSAHFGVVPGRPINEGSSLAQKTIATMRRKTLVESAKS